MYRIPSKSAPREKEVASGEFHENSDSIQGFEKYQ